jgi:hypothetical protein
MTPRIAGAPFERSPGLEQLLGIPRSEAEDYSLEGRLSVIAKLKAARRAEVARGRSGSWLYDLNRHLNVCGALRAEYDALSDFLSERHQPTALLVNSDPVTLARSSGLNALHTA